MNDCVYALQCALCNVLPAYALAITARGLVESFKTILMKVILLKKPFKDIFKGIKSSLSLY